MKSNSPGTDFGKRKKIGRYLAVTAEKKSEPKTVRHVQDHCKLPSAFFLSPSPPSFSRLTSIN